MLKAKFLGEDMKKLVVVALASMSAMGIVQAQSDVTLFGVLDGGITVSTL